MTDAKMMVVFPRNQLTPNDKRRLSENGIIAVEADDPKSVVCVIPSIPFFSDNEIMCVALKTLARVDSTSGNSLFVKSLAARAEMKEGPKT